MVFPGLIYRTKYHLLTLVTKFGFFLNELKVYSILFSFIHDKFKGMQMLLHTQDLGFSSMRRRVLGVWSRTPFLLAICNLFCQIWNSHLRAGKNAILWMWYEHKPPRDYVWKSKLFRDSSISSYKCPSSCEGWYTLPIFMGCLTEPILISEIKDTYVDMWRIQNSNRYNAIVVYHWRFPGALERSAGSSAGHPAKLREVCHQQQLMHNKHSLSPRHY